MPGSAPWLSRGLAAVIAAVAWIGIAVQFGVSFGKTGSVALTVWALLRFFTILSNLFVAILFSGIALGHRQFDRPAMTGGATVTMLLVGIVYGLLLRGLHPLSPAGMLGNILLHMVTPILVPLFWLAFTPKGALRWHDPWVWAAMPVLYLIYALVRGVLGGAYPYPFIDVSRIGWIGMALNALVIAVLFLCASFVLVAFDRWLGRRWNDGSQAAAGIGRT